MSGGAGRGAGGAAGPGGMSGALPGDGTTGAFGEGGMGEKPEGGSFRKPGMSGEPFPAPPYEPDVPIRRAQFLLCELQRRRPSEPVCRLGSPPISRSSCRGVNRMKPR